MPIPSSAPRAGRPVRCATRALKNARYLHTVAPERFAYEAHAEGFGTAIPTNVLGRLHRLHADAPEFAARDQLARFVRANPLPVPGKTARGPLFNGTIHFAHVTFRTPGHTFMISAADMTTIVQYTRRAVVPIGEYASQYGPNGIAVSPAVIPYSVTLSGTSYTDVDVQTWVNDIAVKNQLPASACVLIVSPHGLTAKDVDDNSGYHGKAKKLPYSVFGVFAQNLTPKDEGDHYAMVVSHEIAELVVDPNLDDKNPEVCDPCDTNCGKTLHRAYFDANDKYLGTTPDVPPPFAFSYYICAVVKPAGSADCPASAANCDYGPAAHTAKAKPHP